MFELLYQEGDVHVLVNVAHKGVTIPGSIAASAKEKFIGFVLGMRPSPRLEIRDDGIFTPLRLGGERFQCFFPWECILQMNSKDCVVFFAKGEIEKRLQPSEKNRRPKLMVVKKEDSAG